jgi:hypothetical protein
VIVPIKKLIIKNFMIAGTVKHKIKYLTLNVWDAK